MVAPLLTASAFLAAASPDGGGGVGAGDGADTQVAPTTFDLPHLRKLYSPPFVYPEAAIEDRLQGMVSVRCIIDVRGGLRDCEAVEPVQKYLSDAAVRYVKQSRFEPVVVGGVPVEVDYTFHINFVLPEDGLWGEIEKGSLEDIALHKNDGKPLPKTALEMSGRGLWDSQRPRERATRGASERPSRPCDEAVSESGRAPDAYLSESRHLDLDEGGSCDVSIDGNGKECFVLIGQRYGGWKTEGSSQRRRAKCGETLQTCAGPARCECRQEQRPSP